MTEISGAESDALYPAVSSNGILRTEGTTRALIDIGTNSVKLLVAKVAQDCVDPILEQSEQTRLGRKFYESRRLQPDSIADTAAVVRRFAATAAEHGPKSIQVIATSAARDAVNQIELLSAVERASGLGVEIISGEREAEWVYRGVISDPALANQRLLIMDVGGGSTEFILGDGSQKHFQESFPMGSVRLLEALTPSDPPTPSELASVRSWVRDFVHASVSPDLARASGGATGGWRLVGTGGAATILGRIQFSLTQFVRERLEGARIPIVDVTRMVEQLWSVGLEARRAIVGLPSKRADVILGGSVIYEQVMTELGMGELWLSTRGLRYGGLLDEEARATSKPAL